jgi:N-acetylglucosamine kinase-like BadF-type ATPase
MIAQNPEVDGASFMLGVDGGSTKTIALVADGRGNILGAARGRGSNWTGEDVEIPMSVVVETARRALEVAGVSGSQVALGMFTLAGADWPEDHVRRERFLAEAGIARRVVVKNDAFGGLRAGTSRPYGIVIAAGTGLNAAAIAPDGREWAFGYYETGGGAGDIAWQAFVAVLRAEDGRGRPTALTGLALEKLGFPDVESMLRAHIARRISREALHSLCPLVFTACVAGDEVAAEILSLHGQILAEYAVALTRRFGMEALAFDVVLAGSVFKGQGSLLVDTIREAVQAVAPRAEIVRARFEPVLGSLQLAYDQLEIPVSEEIVANLARTSPEPGFFDTAG